MAVPDYQLISSPLLKLIENGEEISLRDAVDKLANYFELTEEERKELIPNSQQTIFYNRTAVARNELQKQLFIEIPRKGYFKITALGLDSLKNTQQALSISNVINEKSKTMEEVFGITYQELKHNLASEILQTVKSCSPEFFEKLVVDVLVKMGYGGTRKDAGQAIGKSGDEGIDGIINEDRLGLDVIYIQAKRWKDNVGRPEIQKFAGALQGQRAKKGVFITTSYFSNEAKDFVSKIDSKIILIDGITLAHLMIEYNVGVSTIGVYEIKKIDSDYFSDDL
jgi:restriction system protein